MKKQESEARIVLHLPGLRVTLEGLIDAVLDFVKLIVTHRKKAVSIRFFVRGKEIYMVNLTATQKVSYTLKVTDAKGRPAKLDGVPVHSSSDETVATVVAAADGMSGVVNAVNDLGGVCQIKVEGDADLGTGVEAIDAFLDVTVAPGAGGKAAVFELIAGTPEEQ